METLHFKARYEFEKLGRPDHLEIQHISQSLDFA
jgi:hypothetical protein